ncbi:MAG: hypothetical protein ACFFAO_09470 [Candidatus Hermodarchaeota archaeon]
MSNTEWKEVEFKEFVEQFGINPVMNYAPSILYSRKDKEHVAQNSLIVFFLVLSGLLIYISISLFLIEFYFNAITFIFVVIILIGIDILLLYNYIRSNVNIKLIECWIEVYNYLEFYCFSYYPIFSGKVHPNKAKDIVYKLYQDEVFQDKIDITQIEVYLKRNKDKLNDLEVMGFYFQYGKGKHFREENVDRTFWKYFPYEFYAYGNFIASANWDHQFEWRSDLANDFDKLHEFDPWVIKRWNQDNLKPLNPEYKNFLKWNIRNIESLPKLKPWNGKLEQQSYKNQNAYRDLEIIDEAIEKIMGKNTELNKLKDLERELFKFKIYFRDLDLSI